MHFSLHRAQALTIIAISTYILNLGIRSDLDLYIHTRYIAFTIVMSCIALVFGIVYFVASTANDNLSYTNNKLSLLPLIVVLIVAITLPARTLTSSTVSQRTIDSGSATANTSNARTVTSFAGSSKALKLLDWSQLIAANTDPDYYQNKPVSVSGFLYDAGLGNDTVWIARFVLTCCAVDAQPIGVPIQIKNWQERFQQDEWIETEGIFTHVSTANGDQIVLEPEYVISIQEPENPYAN